MGGMACALSATLFCLHSPNPCRSTALKIVKITRWCLILPSYPCPLEFLVARLNVPGSFNPAMITNPRSPYCVWTFFFTPLNQTNCFAVSVYAFVGLPTSGIYPNLDNQRLVLLSLTIKLHLRFKHSQSIWTINQNIGNVFFHQSQWIGHLNQKAQNVFGKLVHTSGRRNLVFNFTTCLHCSRCTSCLFEGKFYCDKNWRE